MDSVNFSGASALSTDEDIGALIEGAGLAQLVAEAAALRDVGHGRHISYSRKVFIPLTRLCRDVCHYCTFADTPHEGEAAYLSPDEVLAIARAGADAGCREALFTLGDKPELRYGAAREALAACGHDSTLSYLAEMCALVQGETGLLPHVNAGVMGRDEIAMLRCVSASQGLMLESASERLCATGGPHHGSPDKAPAARLATIEAAGELSVPFTTGILIGIGETRQERLDALLAIRRLHRSHGHIQEIIVQNFRAKPDMRMAASPEPTIEDMQWTIAAARIIFGPSMNIQAPPNLFPGAHRALIAAGINDWGGVSPVTSDHVNPEAPWPEIETLAETTGAAGKLLVERLAVYPDYARDNDRWQDADMARHVLRASDADGLARDDDWAPGVDASLPTPAIDRASGDPHIGNIIATAIAGAALKIDEIATLFRARGADFDAVCGAADDLRRQTVGDDVTYVVNRNINYTNICNYACSFCAFSKGGRRAGLRGAPYDLALDEIARRAAEAWARGATEVCLQGGIHPDYTGRTYIEICRAVKAAAPGIHIHAFSPLEVWQGAETLGLPPARYLERLMAAGLDTLPGTAAEVLDDGVRAVLCPDKLSVAQWGEIMQAAHEVGFHTTATVMFGHMEGPQSLARHLAVLRDIQDRTGGFTEFVPLPFVHMEAPLYLKGKARKGPTFRETVLMHAVARLALHPVIPNIQVSWVKMGRDGVKACLAAGVNDLGGTLMNENISRAAGTVHGQELAPAGMEELIRAAGRTPRQRTTLYEDVAAERRTASLAAAPLTPVVQTRPRARVEARHG